MNPDTLLSWQLWAILSAVFAALTAIFAKVGVADIDSDLATFIASGPTAPKPERSDVIALRPAVPRTRDRMERVAELYTRGAVKVPPVTLYPLADAAKAVQVSAARHLKGKLVFKLR